MNKNKKLLIHTCCGACLVYPLNCLRDSGFEVRMFFYNPNIHPLEEYLKRLESLQDYLKTEKEMMDVGAYDVLDYFINVDIKAKKGVRCLGCYSLRIGRTAEKAARDGYDYFTTTLLTSPYQDHEHIRQIAEEAGAERDIKFYYEDFREGYYKGVNRFREQELYYQKFCGCLMSEIERFQEKQKKKRRSSTD